MVHNFLRQKIIIDEISLVRTQTTEIESLLFTSRTFASQCDIRDERRDSRAPAAITIPYDNHELHPGSA